MIVGKTQKTATPIWSRVRSAPWASVAYTEASISGASISEASISGASATPFDSACNVRAACRSRLRPYQKTDRDRHVAAISKARTWAHHRNARGFDRPRALALARESNLHRLDGHFCGSPPQIWGLSLFRSQYCSIAISPPIRPVLCATAKPAASQTAF